MRLFKQKRGVALIIVIFAMMIFAILGWTLTTMQSTDFEANLRNYDSERALNAAEAGAQWGLMRLVIGFNCAQITGSVFPHSLNYGQYSCSCDDSVPNQISITSTGYVPSQGSPRAMRSVKVTATQGAFTRSGTVKNLFSWYLIHPGSDIDGDLAAGVFDGDNTPPYSVAGVDYGTNLPPGTGARVLTAEDLPAIDMNYIKTKSQGWGRYRDYTQQRTAQNSGVNNRLRVDVALFNPSMVGEAVRVVGDAVYQWPNENSWVRIASYINNRNVTVNLKSSVGLNNINVWSGKTVRVAKRFQGNVNNQNVWYVEGSDVIVDVRTTAQNGPNINANFNITSLVAEQDILISGSRALSMSTFVDTSNNETYPNLATSTGNIYSTFTPAGSSEAQRANRRAFDGLIYTKTGNINFNYIRGVALIGYNITLDGRVRLDYDDKYVDTNAFIGGVSNVTWQEQ